MSDRTLQHAVRLTTAQRGRLARPPETGDNLPMGRLACLVSVLAVIAVPAAASADVFKLFAEGHGGGMYGVGTTGAQKDAAFFQKARGLTYGALIGAEFMFFDAWIQHHQYINGGLETWTQFGLGVHFTMDMGSPEDRKAHTGGYAELGMGLWYGVGTGAQVRPPLDKAQLTDQGFLGDVRLGFGKHLSNIFDFGVVVPVSYGYFFKDGAGANANDLSTNYRSIQVEGLVVLRGNIKLF